MNEDTAAMRLPILSSGLGKGVDELCELLGAFKGNRVVVAGPDASNAAVTLEPCEADACGLLQERLFRLINRTILTTPLVYLPLNPYSAVDPP
jgi:hypothetical protein